VSYHPLIGRLVEDSGAYSGDDVAAAYETLIAVLGNGSMPLELLEWVVNDWIEAKQG
jgi:hypothetical protein